jgi:hypothetical protein
MLKKKIWANIQRIFEVFPKKFSICSQIYGFGIRDPGSGKNLFRIPDPGVKKAPDPGSGSATMSIASYREESIVVCICSQMEQADIVSYGIHTTEKEHFNNDRLAKYDKYIAFLVITYAK